MAVTGIRSEYDLMETTFAALSQKKNIEFSLFVTGAHLSKSHGFTIKQIINDKYKISKKSKSLKNSNLLKSRILGISKQLKDLVQTICKVNPDLLLVTGDREEAISTAIAGSYLNVPIAHVAGGDRVVGNIDDQIRHAVTKLSHIHFTTNQESYERVIKMGEQRFRVFNVGNPGIDRIFNTRKLSSKKISKLINFNIDYNENYIILIQHPLSSEYKYAYNQMIITLKAIKALKIKTIIISPNSDAGNLDIIRAIKEFKHLKYIYTVSHLDREVYVNLLRNCNCLLGNSSAGILEAPSLKIPVINVGNRQKMRLHSNNVQFVQHNANKIKRAIYKALYDKNYRKSLLNCENPYGDGKTGKKIAKILSKLKIDTKLTTKDITY